MSSTTAVFRAPHVDESRFCELLRPHIELMYRLAWSWTRSTPDAEDLVQDVLIKLAESPDQLESIRELKPWLIKVMHNRYIDLCRHNQAAPFDHTPLDELSVPDRTSDLENFSIREDIESSLEKLSSEQRDTVILHDVQGRSETEVAAILGSSVGTIKSRLHRARRKIRDIIDTGTINPSRSC